MIAIPLLMMTLLGEGPVPSPTPAPAPASPETGSARAGKAGREVVWATSYQEAVQAARKEQKRVLVELVQDQCGECERMDALIIPSTSFWAFTRDKVPVRVPMVTAEGKKLAERFGIPGPPAWIVLTTDGVLCGIQVGSTNQNGWVDTFTRTEASWAQYQKRLEQEKKTPEDIALVFSIAEETYKRGDDGAAEPRFQRVVASSSAADSAKERSLAYLASIAMDQQRFDEAEKQLNQLLAQAKDPVLRERAELRLADLEIARGRRDKALERLRAFRKDHPASTMTMEVEDLIAQLSARTAPAPEPVK